MARMLDDGASQSLGSAGFTISTTPFTMACWFNTDNNAAAQVLMEIYQEGDDAAALWARGDLVGDPVAVSVWDQSALAAGRADSTSGYTVGAWHHACGVCVDNIDRRAYIDGGSKGTNAADRTVANMNAIAIGGDRRPAVDGNFLSGMIALPCAWKCVLSDTQIARLPYVPPWTIEPWAFVALWPFRFNRTWDRDIAGRGGYHLTPTNAPTWADDPLVIRKMWHDWEMLRRKRRWPVQNKPIYTAEIVWGHDTGVLETTVRNIQHNWDGTGDIVNPGVADTEAMALASGEYMIGEITYTGAVDITITYNVYAAGDNINLDYRHGATPAACEAAGWNDYVAAFTSLGYVQARVTSTL